MFYLFRRSIAGGAGGSGGVLAVILGSITAIFQFFWGDLVDGGGFGLSRWMSGFVDIVGLPVLLPLVVYLVLILFRSFSGNYDFANFILLWLIPVVGMKALSWNSVRSPLILIMVPLLWTSLAVGLSLFINSIIRNLRWYVIIFSGLGIIALPCMAITAYWALFSQQTMLGAILFSMTMIPMLISIILDFIQANLR